VTLRSRLAASLLSIAVLLVIPLLIAVRSLDSLHRDAIALQKGEFAASLLLGRLREGLYDLRHQETRLLFVHDSAARDAITKQISEAGRLADSLEAYQLTSAAVGVRRAIRRIETWGPVEYQSALSGRLDRADTISASYIVPALDSADAGVRVAERDLRERMNDRVTQSAASIKRTSTVAIIGMVLALILAAVIAVMLMRFIIRPVFALERGMEAVADGQLDYKLKYDTSEQHEFGKLARSFQSMANQLAELDKLKAEFVSVASHELKTPINVIIGYLQLLEEGIYGPMTSTQVQTLKTIENQVLSLNRLVRQLLDVSRFEAGGGRLEPRPADLAKFLDDLERSFHVLALQRGVKFTIERRQGLPDEVVWDIDRINEVLGNLLSNAFKFTEKGGRVDLVVGPDHHSVVMSVRDTGAGIPPEQLPRVFEKFYQADNQGSASASGSGLGLAIAKQIVEAHGGTISCDSTVGVGTTFTITLPVHVQRRSASIHLTAVPS
jgi:signal transduction histidine kinase